MIVPFGRPCSTHRAALLDFVDRREVGGATPAALAHLERCGACEAELGATVLTIAALRRMHVEVDAVEPPPDAWLRLRDQVTRRADPWRWRASLGSLVTSAFLAAVLVLPTSLGGPAVTDRPLDLPDSRAGLELENRYLATSRAGTLPPLPPIVRVERVAGSVPQQYPPEIASVRKEVPATPVPLRSAKPI